MQIYIARNSSQLGVFSPEEVTAGLSSGRFFLTDLAWREGMTNWTPLAEWLEFRADSITLPASVSRKNDFINASLNKPSWELGSSFANYFATIKEVALEPVQTFANLRNGGYERPISFTYWSLLPTWLLSTFIIGVYLTVFFGVLDSEFQKSGNSIANVGWFNELGMFGKISTVSGFLFVYFLLFPFLSFIGTAINHLLLLPWSPSGGFKQTYRAQAYSMCAFLPFFCIPCLNYVAIPWQIVASIIAQSQVHKIAWWKVAISLFVIPCCCICALFALLISFLYSSSTIPF